METGITLSIYPEDDYHYDVDVHLDEIAVVYNESGIEKSRMSFGSIEEMEAVARAMLRAVQLGREM
jgi:hypothetical protein